MTFDELEGIYFTVCRALVHRAIQNAVDSYPDVAATLSEEGYQVRFYTDPDPCDVFLVRRAGASIEAWQPGTGDGTGFLEALKAQFCSLKWTVRWIAVMVKRVEDGEIWFPLSGNAEALEDILSKYGIKTIKRITDARQRYGGQQP